MNVGFETIGNATLICYDNGPILSTDPWIQGEAYFGSWALSHEIPETQRQAVLNSKYIWFSHGHPDHLNPNCIPLFKDKKILLADHVGKRIYNDLTKQGFQVEILPDRTWVRLSSRIRVLTIADYLQDSVILVEINGRLIANLNDTAHHGWKRTVRRILSQYPKNYLLSLTGFGDVDMIHFFDENGCFIEPAAARKDPIGPSIAAACADLGAKVFIPFSAFHRYQRTDSIWANHYTTAVSDHAVGFQSTTAQLWPAFLAVDCERDYFTEINPSLTKKEIFEPTHFGDNWSELLEKEDTKLCRDYFNRFEKLRNTLDWICLKVGGKDYRIEWNNKEKKNRAITFEAPRHSLMTCIQHKIFDDLLIGNFMRTTLHGKWPSSKLYPDFNPPLTKYGDNGGAYTNQEVESYLETYRNRSFDEKLHHWEGITRQWFERYTQRESAVFNAARNLYRAFRTLMG